jgi:hypothetical protein
MQRLQVPTGERVHEAAECLPVRPEPDDNQPRVCDARNDQRPGGEKQVPPLETINFPT